MQELSPLVKWAGGKRAMLPSTLPFFPPKDSYTRYVEPFLGGGAFLFSLQPKPAVAADSNPELMNFYGFVKKDPGQLSQLLDDLSASYNRNPREHYLQIRTDYNAVMGQKNIEQAARFLFLNKTCFNGLYRVNRSGLFNVPFGGRNTAPQIYDRANLNRISKYLQRKVSVKCQDFRTTLSQCKEGDLIFCDPPYIHPNSFTDYNVSGFNRKDYEDMVELLVEANRLGAKVIISNSLDDQNLFRGFKQGTIERGTSISGFTKARVRSPEYIYTLG